MKQMYVSIISTGSLEDGRSKLAEYAINLIAIPEKLVAGDAVLDIDAVHLLQILFEALLAA